MRAISAAGTTVAAGRRDVERVRRVEHEADVVAEVGPDRARSSRSRSSSGSRRRRSPRSPCSWSQPVEVDRRGTTECTVLHDPQVAARRVDDVLQLEPGRPALQRRRPPSRAAPRRSGHRARSSAAIARGDARLRAAGLSRRRALGMPRTHAGRRVSEPRARAAACGGDSTVSACHRAPHEDRRHHRPRLAGSRGARAHGRGRHGRRAAELLPRHARGARRDRARWSATRPAAPAARSRSSRTSRARRCASARSTDDNVELQRRRRVTFVCRTPTARGQRRAA